MDHGCTRKVRFSEDSVVCVLEARSDEHRNLAKRVDPRKAAREQAYILIPKGYGHLLSGCFEDPIDSCQENLNAFVAGVPDRDNSRGLERYMSQQHKEERDQAREDVIEAVLRRQQRLKLDGENADDVANKLRSACRRHSRDSRVFARRLGIADDLAARGDKSGQSETPAFSDRFALPQHRYSYPSATNAKPGLRHPPTNQLNTGIRAMAASMNAKKASRQASIRKLNSSIRNLASSLHGSSRSLCSFSSASTSSNSSTESCSSFIHPSLVVSRNRDRDQAMKLPGRPSKPSECAEIIQTALELVDCTNDGQETEDERSATGNIAKSA